MFGSAPAAPAPPALPDPLASAPQYASGSATKATGQSKVPGFGSTLLTSGQGVDSTGTNSARKSLLGQ